MPLAPDHCMDSQTFERSLDANAMPVLESMGPVSAAARAISGRVGRPWFEATVNGIRLSERQFPDTFAIGIRATRIMLLGRNAGSKSLRRTALGRDDAWQ